MPNPRSEVDLSVLAPGQRVIYELREAETPPLTFSEIGRRLGKTEQAAQQGYAKACKKLGVERRAHRLPAAPPAAPPPKKPRTVKAQAVERRNPEAAADVILDATSPLEKRFARIAEDAGLPRQVTRNLIERLRSRYLPVSSMLQEVQNHDLDLLWGTTAKTILESITLEDISNASLRDKGILAGIATDKLLILRGQPNQIIQTQDERGTVRELIAAFIKEADRRGEVIEVGEHGAVKLVSEHVDGPPT